MRFQSTYCSSVLRKKLRATDADHMVRKCSNMKQNHEKFASWFIKFGLIRKMFAVSPLKLLPYRPRLVWWWEESLKRSQEERPCMWLFHSHHHHPGHFHLFCSMPHAIVPRILFIDAYDSFSNNIISLVQSNLEVDVTVIRIDKKTGWSSFISDALRGGFCRPRSRSPEEPFRCGLAQRLVGSGKSKSATSFGYMSRVSKPCSRLRGKGGCTAGPAAWYSQENSIEKRIYLRRNSRYYRRSITLVARHYQWSVYKRCSWR